MIVEVHTDFSAAFDVKVTNPSTTVWQKDLEIVMSGLEFDHTNCLRCIALGLSIDLQRKATGISRDFDLAVLDFLLLGRISGTCRRLNPAQRLAHRSEAVGRLLLSRPSMPERPLASLEPKYLPSVDQWRLPG